MVSPNIVNWLINAVFCRAVSCSQGANNEKNSVRLVDLLDEKFLLYQ